MEKEQDIKEKIEEIKVQQFADKIGVSIKNEHLFKVHKNQVFCWQFLFFVVLIGMIAISGANAYKEYQDKQKEDSFSSGTIISQIIKGCDELKLNGEINITIGNTKDIIHFKCNNGQYIMSSQLGD